jgi:DUF4097 and DUF4098 domain-containing protein YvlB
MGRLVLMSLMSLAAGIALPLAALAERIEKQVPVAAGRQLEIDLEAPGAITLRGSDAAVAAFVIDREGRDVTDTEVAVEPASGGGARLTTRFAPGKKKYGSHLKIEVRLPRHFDVQLLSMGGGVHFQELDGNFEGRTMSGELELTDLTGTVDLKTMRGDIRIARSRLDGSLTTMAGNVRFSGVQGSVKGQTQRGSVIGRATSASAAARRPIEIFSVGDLNIEDAPDGANLKTMRGNVVVRSAAKLVKAFTMSGNIAIDRIDGQVEARTMSGNVSVVMQGGSQPGNYGAKLEAQSGDVHLAVPANLAMDIDVTLVSSARGGGSHKVHSDFPLKTEESSESGSLLKPPRRVVHATGSQGAASHRIELRAVNGDVYLTRSK